jgi:hypothetical protein
MITNTGVTIFNKYLDGSAEKFQRTQVSDVAWEDRQQVSAFQPNDTVLVMIPMERGANYVDPVAWKALTSKTGKWTLQPGDFIVKGMVSDEISTSFTPTKLLAKYDHVAKINAVITNDNGSEPLRHWQLGAS